MILMFKRQQFFFAFIFLFLMIWATAYWENRTFRHQFHYFKEIGLFFGAAGYLFLSLTFLLSSRLKILEKTVAPLDQLYHLHHQLGLWGFIFCCIHPFIVALKWIPYRLDKFFLFIFPFHKRLSVNLGSLSLLLMAILISITILKLLPYDKWKLTHRLMSIVFILATLHIVLARNFNFLTFPDLLLFIPMGLGLFGIIYKQIISYFMEYPLYEVVKTNIKNDNLIEISLKAKKQKLCFIPGQYAFFRFKSDHISNESHPFTLCGSPNDSILSILVKARGDFTKSLYQNLQLGDQVYLEGPYGQFDYTKFDVPQIWIAGGIGIVPFLAWIRLFNESYKKNSITLFYCIHRKADAAFAEEFLQISKKFPFFRFFLFCSEENNRLHIQKILDLEGTLKNKAIFMCGPKKLTKSFFKEFLTLGVERDQIHFEDFEFF